LTSKNIDFRRLGFMQGRLVQKFQGKYQAHPIDNWFLKLLKKNT